MRQHEPLELMHWRADRLMRWIIAGFALLGVVFIATGLVLYVATAPPIGGLHWHAEDIAISLAFIIGGWAILTITTKENQ